MIEFEDEVPYEHPYGRFDRDYPAMDDDFERTFVHRSKERNERLYVCGECGRSALAGVGALGNGWNFPAGRVRTDEEEANWVYPECNEPH